MYRISWLIILFSGWLFAQATEDYFIQDFLLKSVEKTEKQVPAEFEYLEINQQADKRLISATPMPKLKPQNQQIVLKNSNMIVVRKKSHQREQTKNLLANADKALLIGHSEVAYKFYLQVLKQDKQNLAALSGVAYIFHREKSYQLAKITYKKILLIDKNNVFAVNNLISILATESLAEIRAFMLRNQHFSENAAINAQLGLIFAKQKNYHDAAIFLKRAVSLEPSNLRYRYVLANVLTKLKLFKKAYIQFSHLKKQLSHANNNESLKLTEINFKMQHLRKIIKRRGR